MEVRKFRQPAEQNLATHNFVEQDSAASTRILRAEVEELSRQIEILHLQVERIQEEQKRSRRELEESLLFLAETITKKHSLFSNVLAELRSRVDRYINLGPLKFLRQLRKKLLGLN